MTGVTIYSAPLPEGPEASHRLLRRAAALAAPQLTDCTLARQAQGKPWFPAAPELHFSISHSGGCWVCRGLSALPEAIVLAPDGQFPARPDARLQLLPVFDGYSLCVCTKDAARVALREL